jgi:hypothetical protein
MEYPGHVHAALDDVPAKYAAMEYAVTKQRKFQEAMEAQGRQVLKEGGDLTDPETQLDALARAYEYASRQVFMQENRFVQWFRKVTERKPDDSAASKLARGFAETLLPIVKVPTNWTWERMDYLAGLPRGSYRLYEAIKRGVDSVPYEEGDAIARQLKKGTFGLGLAWLGTAAADQIGGYWWEKRRFKEEEPKEGEIELFGVTIPRNLLDHPAVAQLHFFATVEKLRQRYRDDGLGRGLRAASKATIEEVPFAEVPFDVKDALEDDYGYRTFWGRYLRGMTLPPDVQRLARVLDQKGDHSGLEMLVQQLGLKHIDARKRPTDEIFPDEMQLGVPGLRDDVR